MKKVQVPYFVYVLLIYSITACQQQVSGPVVQAVYPSSDRLPENLLRLYIHFSHPMKTVGNLDKIKLLDEQGKEVKNVFFNNAYELWNKEQTQLTLILDPARVKQGLQAHESLGRALVPEQSYRLVLADLEDIHHQQLAQTFEKKFLVEEADLAEPDIAKWKMHLPSPKSKSPLRIQFPDMLDYNSLLSRLIITDRQHKPIPGTIRIEHKETQWKFEPLEPWKNGAYTLHVNSRLEDPAGNNLNGLFDHPLGQLKYQKEGRVETIPFTIEEQ